MKKAITFIFLIIFSTFSSLSLADDYAASIETFKQSPSTASFFKNAYGYAVFPTIGKGGLGIGGAFGKGQVYKAGVLVGKTNMSQLSFGFQAGGQAFSQIIFFENKAAFEDFTSGNFEFGANASAVAITLGAQAQAGSTGMSSSQGYEGNKTVQNAARYRKGMAIMVFAKGGLMYEAAIAGQKYNYEPIK